jgi:hypothetical protein
MTARLLWLSLQGCCLLLLLLLLLLLVITKPMAVDELSCKHACAVLGHSRLKNSWVL